MKRFAWLLFFLLLPVCALAQTNDSFAYVLPQTETLGVGEPLRIDFMPLKSGRVIFRVLDETGAQCARFGVIKDKNVPTKYKWDGKSNGQPLSEGQYTLTVRYERDDETQALRFPLTLVSRAAPTLQDELTFLPASMADEDVWKAMQSPIFVADVAERSHQKVYTAPDKKSAVAGKIHGQSQAVDILKAPENGFVYVGFYRHEDGAYTEGYLPENVLIPVVPNEHYGLLLDKQAQTLTVYVDGAPFSTVPVTTGQMVKGDTERETRAGAFVITDHLKAFSSHGMAYEYPLGFDGGNLFHQVGYQKINGVKDFSVENALLGQKDSHGCVRVGNEENAPGVNASWLYTHIPYHTKVLVLNDLATWESRMIEIGAMEPQEATTTPPPAEQAPIIQAAALPGLLTEQEYLSTLPENNMQQITITAGGDCVLGSEEKTRSNAASFDSMVAQNGYAWPFSGLLDVFSSDDVTFVNLECVLKDNAKDKASGRMYNFRGPTAFIEILQLGSVELVNIANNHYIDYGANGKRSTRNALTAAGIPFSGYGYTYVFEKDGLKIGFGGIRETTYKQSKKQVDEDIQNLKAQGCDVIIYACHFGTEYERTHNELQTEIAHRAIDAGADIVIGHHPHVVQGIEIYKNCPIFYSLGNLVFGGNLELTEFDALALRLTLDFAGGAYVGVRIDLLPILDTASAPKNDFHPMPATGEDAQRILQKIQADTPFALTLSPMGVLR